MNLTDKTTYAVDGKIVATVVFAGSNSTAITGRASLLSSLVTVGNATLSVAWAESSTKGTYTATYIANTAGTSLYATLDLSSYGSSTTKSSAYAIVVPTITTLTNTNSLAYSASLSTPFPQTGFIGAKFTVGLSAGVLSDYTWTSSQSWLTVSNGVVTFNSAPTTATKSVTITGTTTNTTVTYTFSLAYWYIEAGQQGAASMLNTSANTYCTGLGYSLPTVAQLNGSGSDAGTAKTIGSLWGEWGKLSAYNSGFSNGAAYFSNQSPTSTYSYYVYTDTGIRKTGGTGAKTACRVDL